MSFDWYGPGVLSIHKRRTTIAQLGCCMRCSRTSSQTSLRRRVWDVWIMDYGPSYYHCIISQGRRRTAIDFGGLMRIIWEWREGPGTTLHVDVEAGLRCGCLGPVDGDGRVFDTAPSAESLANKTKSRFYRRERCLLRWRRSVVPRCGRNTPPTG